MSDLEKTYRIIETAERERPELVAALRKRYANRRKVSVSELHRRHGHDAGEHQLAFAIVATN